VTDASSLPAADAGGALASVHRLERELEASRATRSAAESLVEEARLEGARLVEDARARALEARSARHRAALESAHREAAAIAEGGRSAEATLRSRAEAQWDATVDAALDLVLPAPPGRQA
jgi:hypothetical protein